jgi:hypothetical protein
MDMHEGEGNQGPASKVFTHKAVDGFSILKPAQQGREAFGLIVQGKHGLVNDCKSGVARLSLGDPILEYSQLPSFRAISPKVIGDRIGVRIKPHEDAHLHGKPQLHYQDTHLHSAE